MKNINIKKTCYLLIFIIIPIFSYSQDDDAEETPQKKEFLGGLRSKFRKSESKNESVENESGDTKRGFFSFRKKKKDKDARKAGKENKYQGQVGAQDLTEEESQKVEEMMEKYKLTDDERYIKSMYKSGEPLNTKGKRKLKKLQKKEAKLNKKLHKFHIKRNRDIQDKETKKRMKKNRKAANKRMKKRY